MTERRNVLTPEALAMMDTIARTGSFAAAARELGKVPSALTYNVRQLEDALDVLLFDRSSRQAQLTAAGEELLNEGRRLLAEMDAVANRVRRVATGWETQLTVAVDTIISQVTVFELCEAFYSRCSEQGVEHGTRLRVRSEVLAGTWEALLSGQADLAIGVGTHATPPAGIEFALLGDIDFVFAVAPHHPLANHQGPISDAELLRHRAVAVADSAQRLTPITVNLLDPEVQQCPYPAYRTLRDESPVYQQPGTGVYVVTRYEDVRTVLTDPERFPSASRDTPFRPSVTSIERAKKVAARFEEKGWIPAPTLAGRDDPNHKQMRAMFNDAFKPSRIKDIDPLVESLAYELIDGFIDDGHCDWVEQFAVPLPLFIIGDNFRSNHDDQIALDLR